MGNQSSRDQADAYESESVIPFGHSPKNGGSNEAAQLDNAGQTILRLLHKAAGVAEANCQHALDMAQKLSHQLRAAEDRIAELDAEVRMYKEEPSVPNNGSIKSIRKWKICLSSAPKKSSAA